VLDLLERRTFRKAEFTESSDGHVRLLAPLTHELAETMPLWAKSLGPIAEHVATYSARPWTARTRPPHRSRPGVIAMRRPRVPVETVHVLELEDLRKLLATAPPKSRDFLDVRDRAIMLLFCDTGMRLSELAGLKMDDIDRERDCAQVMGKGHKPRVCPYTPATATSLDRYLRMRREQKHAKLEHLWITRQGYATGSAIYRVIRNRAQLAGLGDVHPHQLRHSWAHDGLANGESEGDMMVLGGWSNRKMLERYGRELAADRAIAARRRHGGLGDRI
jgi:integrase